jgi:photosystem II stability/assembly factor-like uncharacterized protein
MIMRSVVSQFRLQNAIWMLLLIGCNSEPVVPIRPQATTLLVQGEFFVLPGSSIVIDLQSVVNQPFNNTSLTIIEQPLTGTLTQLDSDLLKYTSENFGQGTDQFTFSAELDNSARPVSGLIRINGTSKLSEFPCDIYPVRDFVKTSKKSITSIKPLTNDRICGANGLVDVFIRIQPNFGDAVVSGDSIIYTPKPSFEESDELVYGMLVSGSNEVSYGIVSFDKNEAFAISAGFTDIFFVNDSVGFISGGNMLFKTNDGGRQWKEMVYPREEFETINIEEIFFLNTDIGFAAFSKCLNENDSGCSGGWMMTSDGGLSWKRVELTVPVTSIFFISTSTGYLSTSKIIEDYWDAYVRYTILKTIDGGETWEQVFENSALLGDLKVRFLNEELGYAFQIDNIYSTTNGGKTWRPSLPTGYVGSLASVEDIAFASFNSTLSYITPSIMVRSTGGTDWKQVSSFSNSILAHDFSPSGNLGVAVGISGMNGSISNLSINKTTDKGETWAKVPGDFSGFPSAISIPSDNVAYILCSDKIIKFNP